MDISQPVLIKVSDRDSFFRRLSRIALFYVSLALAGAFVTFVIEVYVQFPSERRSLLFLLGVLCGIAFALVLQRVRPDLIQLDWLVKVEALLQARMLERKARSAQRYAAADTLTQLRFIRNGLRHNFGKQLFASFGECSPVVVVDEENYFGCLFFQHALENIGFHVILQPIDFGRGVQPTLYNIIYFIPLPKQLALKFHPDAISLNALATDDADSWDTFVHLLPEFPHGSDVWLRRYFQLAASHVRVPPESLGATSGVTSYR